METSAAPVITISSSPGFTPRLLSDHIGQGREDLAAYRQLGGYQPLAGADELVGEVESSGLLGRGGAGFPLAVKVRAVRDNGRAAGGAVVVANGEEGEPASIKDRWLLRHRPHLILDGLRLAAAMVGADRTYVYVSDPESARSVEAALAELGPDAFDGVAVEVRSVEPGYVAGEETAAVRALNGGPVKPTDKPPRPFQEGVGGLPTLVSNVETLASLPYLQRHGSAEFRSLGTSQSPGSFLVTVTGAGRAPGLYEIPHGLPFPELLALHGVSSDQVQGVLMGGYFAGLLDRGVLDATLDYETLRATRKRPGQRCDSGDHRRMSARGCRVGAGLLRPRKRRAMRLLLQRDRGDGRGRRGTARRRRDRGGPGPATPLVCGASRPWCMRDA